MQALAESWRSVLERPLDYLHAQRFNLPVDMDTPALRGVLNPLLLRALRLDSPEWSAAAGMPWVPYWLSHWQHLPAAARLMGAYLLWPQLARGARLQHLDAAQRCFAGLALGPRQPWARARDIATDTQIEAAGLAALCAWTQHLPAALMQRLPLLFSPEAQALHPELPVAVADARLLMLAVQHARFS